MVRAEYEALETKRFRAEVTITVVPDQEVEECPGRENAEKLNHRDPCVRGHGGRKL